MGQSRLYPVVNINGKAKEAIENIATPSVLFIGNGDVAQNGIFEVDNTDGGDLKSNLIFDQFKDKSDEYSKFLQGFKKVNRYTPINTLLYSFDQGSEASTTITLTGDPQENGELKYRFINSENTMIIPIRKTDTINNIIQKFEDYTLPDFDITNIGTATSGSLTTGSITPDSFDGVSDGYFTIDIDGNTKDLKDLTFTASSTLASIQGVLSTAINTPNVIANLTNDTNNITITSVLTGQNSKVSITQTPTTTGTDLTTAGFLNIDGSNSEIGRNGNIIKITTKAQGEYLNAYKTTDLTINVPSGLAVSLDIDFTGGLGKIDLTNQSFEDLKKPITYIVVGNSVDPTTIGKLVDYIKDNLNEKNEFTESELIVSFDNITDFTTFKTTNRSQIGIMGFYSIPKTNNNTSSNGHIAEFIPYLLGYWCGLENVKFEGGIDISRFTGLTGVGGYGGFYQASIPNYNTIAPDLPIARGEIDNVIKNSGINYFYSDKKSVLTSEVITTYELDDQVFLYRNQVKQRQAVDQYILESSKLTFNKKIIMEDTKNVVGSLPVISKDTIKAYFIEWYKFLQSNAIVDNIKLITDTIKIIKIPNINGGFEIESDIYLTNQLRRLDFKLVFNT